MTNSEHDAIFIKNIMTVKQIIVIRDDLNMSREKLASQVAHASIKLIVDAMKNYIDEYEPDNLLTVWIAYNDTGSSFRWKTLSLNHGLTVHSLRL